MVKKLQKWLTHNCCPCYNISRRQAIMFGYMVAVVKRLTRRIVAPLLEGSIPFSHPIIS